MATLAGSSFAVFTPAAAAYSAGDVIATAQEFKGVGAWSGGETIITSVSLEVDATALQASEANYFLELYSVTPPSAYADNAAWDLPSGDRAYHVASIDLGTVTDKGSTLKLETTAVNKQVSVPTGGSLFGYLVTVAGFTATAVARKVTLHCLPV